MACGGSPFCMCGWFLRLPAPLSPGLQGICHAAVDAQQLGDKRRSLAERESRASQNG